jgi:hypothetical protein
MPARRLSPAGNMLRPPLKARMTAVVGLTLCLAAPSALVAQECPGGVVSEISYDRHKPFGEEATGPDAGAGWLFRGLNSAHVRTKPTVIRWELLFSEGDCFDPALLEESARSLRSLPYIIEAELTSERLPDGSHRVNVRTIDAWALSLAISFTVDEGFQFTGLSVNAKNLFGTGTQVAAFRNVYRERKRLGFLARQPNLFGTRIDGAVHGGETRSGDYITQSFYRPFAGEVGVNAFRQAAHFRDDYFLYSVDPALGFTQVYQRFEAERYEASYQRRFGDEDGAKFIGGIGVSREEIRFPFGAGGVRIVSDNDFENPIDAPPEVAEAVRAQSLAHATNRVSFTVGARDVRFFDIIGLDAIRATQDLLVGSDFTFTVAPGIPVGSDNISDVLLLAQGAVAVRSGDAYTRIDADVQARNVSTDLEGGPEGWRDVLWQLNVNTYLDQTENATLFGRFQFAGGDNMDRPFQLTVGGRESVRGYNEDAYPGGQRMLATLEQRISVPRLNTGFADVGLAFFADAGRSRAAGVPFGEDTGWKAGVGAGLRLALPAGAPNVLRIDVGMPVTGDRQTRGAVFRIYSELFGLLDRRAWPTQIQRSRWYGIDPDLTTRPNNPLAGN